MEVALATTAVKIVLGKIGDLAVDKVFELRDVSNEVERMRVELTLIVGVLEDVGPKPNSESRAVKNWLIELRRVAENIAKDIEFFKSEIPKGKWEAIFKKPKKLHKLSTRLKNSTQILKTLYECGKQLEITPRAIAIKDPTAPSNQLTVDQIPLLLVLLLLKISQTFQSPQVVGTTSSTTTTEDSAPLPLTPPNKSSDVDDPEVFVGHEFDRRNIIGQLLNKEILRRTVLSIVGIGGLGKTTLAQKIYNSSELEGHFQCIVWQSISQQFTHDNVLREILYSINPQMKKKNPQLEDVKELVTKIKSYLNDKKYLIILDDVWKTDLWNGLKKALPDVNNGSRVIITTRFLNVARAADPIDPYKLGYLTDDESVALLFKTALHCDINPENVALLFKTTALQCDLNPLVRELKDVARELIRKCGGLPLAVVVLGGILSGEDRTPYAWGLLHKTMNWHDDQEVEMKCMRILAKSYEVLPFHLKHCFFYFACFPEDHNISAKQMTRMWVIEELISKDGAGSLEDRAENCLLELVKRCLVEVTKKSANGYLKYCRMHDLLRDLAVHKAKEINFVNVFSKDGGGGNQQLAPNRVALQNCIPKEFGIHSTKTRSLFCFGRNIPNYQRFGQLSLLVFERVNLTLTNISSYKNWLEGLVHLRYLGFRHCRKIYPDMEYLQELFSISYSGLKSLETLDCKGTMIGVNSSLWEIPTLRHVITGLGSVVQCPLNWSHLKNLQRLDWVCLNEIPTLECNVNLHNLHTLKIEMYFSLEWNVIDWMGDTDTLQKKWQDIRALLSRTEHLVSLSIHSNLKDLPFPSEGTSGLSCHGTIQSLYLRGAWWVRDAPVSMSVEMFPKYLIKLKLELSHLKEDPMPILKRLQSLRILHLLHNSYSGLKMICSTSGFASLQKLRLQQLEFLSDWVIKEGALPVLRQLAINRCEKLYTLPDLQNVPSLQELVVAGVSSQLYERSKKEDRHKIEHIPSLQITMKG